MGSNRLSKAALWVRLTDARGRLSVSNLSALAAMVNYLVTATCWENLALVAATLANYGYKRSREDKEPEPITVAYSERLTELESFKSGMELRLGLKNE